MYPGDKAEDSLRRTASAGGRHSLLSPLRLTEDLIGSMLYSAIAVDLLDKPVEEPIDVSAAYGDFKAYAKRHDSAKYMELGRPEEDVSALEPIACYARSGEIIAGRLLLISGSSIMVLPFNSRKPAKKDIKDLIELAQICCRPLQVDVAEEKAPTEAEPPERDLAKSPLSEDGSPETGPTDHQIESGARDTGAKHPIIIEIRESNHWVRCKSEEYDINVNLHVASDREFGFLCALADSYGEAVAKENIKDRIAGYPNSDIDVDLPDVKRRLRKRFVSHGFPAERFEEMIHAVTGLGYVLNARAEYV